MSTIFFFYGAPIEKFKFVHSWESFRCFESLVRLKFDYISREIWLDSLKFDWNSIKTLNYLEKINKLIKFLFFFFLNAIKCEN